MSIVTWQRTVIAVAAMCICLAGAGLGADSWVAAQPAVVRPIASQTQTIVSPPVSAPNGTTPPAVISDYENQPLSFGSPRSGRTSARSAYSGLSILSSLLGVGLICGALFFFLQLVKKYVPGHRRFFSHPALEILGSTHLDQRRSISLLRVGRRVIVVGMSPEGMRSLSEITDEAEVTEIMEVARPKGEAGLSVFQKLFQRTVLEADQAMEERKKELRADATAQQLEDNLASLEEQVRGMQNQGGEGSGAEGRGERRSVSRRIDAIG